MKSVVNLRDAAEVYRKKGWAAIPLENDANGYPKKPFTPNWQVQSPYAPPQSAETWARATGLGLVLGRVSNGLCAIDIDDVELAKLAFEVCPWTRTVESVRHRAHLYFIEQTPSVSRRLTISYQGRDVCVELKSTGTQVAAPPTPGYTRRSGLTIKPTVTPTLAAAWERVARLLGIPTSPATPTAPHIPAWSPFVPKDHRNNTLYIEAHRLREAGLSLELALDHLRHRFETRYEVGEFTWEECERTIKSAYQKLTPERVDGRNTYQLWFGRDTPNDGRAGESSSDNSAEHPP